MKTIISIVLTLIFTALFALIALAMAVMAAIQFIRDIFTSEAKHAEMRENTYYRMF
jgi:hypothetical protein